MSSTLASLGLPEPEPAKRDTLAALGLPEPVRPGGGRSRGKGGGASWPDPYSPGEIARRDEPLGDEGLGPAAWPLLFWGGGAGYKAGEAATKNLASWLARKAASGAASGAAAGGVEAASREANPVPFVLGGAAGGALLGPPVEAAIPAVGRLVGRLMPQRKAPVALPEPAVRDPGPSGAVSPVEPTSAPPVASQPVNPGAASVAKPVPPGPGSPANMAELRRAEHQRIMAMSPDDLAAEAAAAKAAEKDDVVAVFGPERAKVYNRNFRIANSAYADQKKADEAYKIVKEMEDSLSPEAQNRLFGIGHAHESNADELARFANAARDYSPEMLAEKADAALLNDAARELSRGGLVDDTERLIRLRGVMQEMARRGKSEADVLAALRMRSRAGEGSVDDLAEIMQGNLKDLRAATSTAAEPMQPRALPAATPVPPAQPKAVPPPGPVTGANAQQFPALGEFVEQVKADPAYLARVKELGGGRVVSNKETLARAAEAGPMDPSELAAWPADAPIDPVTQTRGLLTFDYFQQARTRAIASGDLTAAAAAQKTIAGLMPGVENLRATGGRVTQAQAMFVQDEMSKILDSLADMQAKGVPFEQVQAKANELLKQAATAARAKKLSSEWREALGGIETAATFAKLTSPVTHAVNTISNALTFGVVRPLEKAGTALAYLGQRNLPAARAEVSTLFGTRMGFRSGFERYVRTLMDDVAEPGKLAEVTGGRNIPLPRALRPFDVFRQLAAADGFWKGVLRDARLNELAHRSAAAEGLKGPALAARIKALVDNPPANWTAEVDAYAKEFTFQSDPDRFLSAVQKVQGLPFVRLFIPFVQTPYNLARFQFQRSGAGLLSPRNVKGLAAGGQAQAEAIGRLTAGAGLSAGALAFVSTTEATGDYPSDPRERERWKAQGIKPYSLRLPNGTWIAYNRFAPVGMYIGQAVALREAMGRGNEQGIAGAASTLAASSLKQINDMPFLSGLSDLLDAVKEPDRSAERFAQGVVTGLVPNILRDVRQQADSTMREARGVPQAVANMVPGLSQKLPASIDVLGRERTYEPSRLLRATKVLSTQRTSPETDLFARLEWSPNAPSLTLEKGKEKKKLEGEQAAQFKREMGAATEKAIRDVMASHPNLDKMEREDAVELIQKKVDAARKPVRKRWTDRTMVLKGKL